MINLRLAGLAVYLLAQLHQLAQSSQPGQFNPQADSRKITFDLSAISPEGLVGSGSSVRALSYEFCIPATVQARLEVQAIDPSVQSFTHSGGRIGCRSDQYLYVGSTHQRNWHSVLQQLTQLDYITRIDPFWGE